MRILQIQIFCGTDGSVFLVMHWLGKRAIGMGKAGGGGVSRRRHCYSWRKGFEMFIQMLEEELFKMVRLSLVAGSTIINQGR